MMKGISIIQRVADRRAVVRISDKLWLDLIGSMGKSILAFLSALAGDERERITNRADDDSAVAKARGVKFEPMPKLSKHQGSVGIEWLAQVESCRAIAEDMDVPHTTISRLR